MLNITLWVLQALLALAFLAHGWLYLQPPAEMVEQMNAAINPSFRIFIGATVFHVSRSEMSSAAVTAVILALAAFVAYMRWRVKPIAPRASA